MPATHRSTEPPAPPVHQLDELERLTHSELEARVHRPLLADQLAHILRHSAFYRERLGDLSPGVALARFTTLPFSGKRAILADQAAHPPYGRLAAPQRDLRRVHTTSGTTGTPFCIVLTEDDCAATLEAGRRAFRCAGLTADDTVVHCLNYCLWAGGLTDHLSLEATGALVLPFGVGQTRRLLETILHQRPTAISCTPSYLSRLEVVLRDELGMEPRALGLQKALCGGEGGLQSPAVRKRIEDRWGIQAIDANYGMADVLSIFGAECPARQGLHFHGQGLLHVELIQPETGEPLPIVTGAVGELVATNLRRQAQPLLRYRTGDLWRVLGTDDCECGRSGLRFVPVGRADQMVIVRGVNVFPSAVAQLLGDGAEGAWFSGEFELVLDRPPPIDAVLLRVELSSAVPDPERVRAYLLQLCRQRLNFTPQIELLSFGQFPRTEGKTPRVRRTYGAS